VHEAGLVKDAKVPRNTGLIDVDRVDDVVDRVLAAAKHLDDAAARGVGESLKGIKLP